MGLDTLCDGEPDCNRQTVCGGDPTCNANIATSPDEVNPLCESKFPSIFLAPCIISCFHADKCLLPHYGACPYSRLCETSVFGVRCGNCLPGGARQTRFDSTGNCIRKLFNTVLIYLKSHIYSFHSTAANFQFSLSAFSVAENAGPLIGSVTLVTAGFIEEQILVVVQTEATGTAPGNAELELTVQYTIE